MNLREEKRIQTEERTSKELDEQMRAETEEWEHNIKQHRSSNIGDEEIELGIVYE